ncbi:MAG: ABC transporter substrate-binding protein [Eubacteriales bacterium]
MKKIACMMIALLMALASLGALAEAPTDVTVILDYIPNTNHTGMYVALDKGYYAEAGLNVQIIEPTEGATNTLVAVGKGDFGIAYQEDVTLARAMDEPLPIRAIAALIQHNTSGFVSWAGKNITSVRDFEGKTYAGWGGPGEEAVLRAVMEAEGLDFSTLNMIIADGSFTALEKDVDLMWFFEAWDMITCQMNGFDLNYIPVRDLDPRLDYYTPVIITNEDMISNHPDTVKAFLEATRRGYMDAIADPDGCAEVLNKYAPDYALVFLTASQEYLTDKYMQDTDRWGEMKQSVWDGYTDFMVEYGMIDAPIAADQLYTNDFLPEAE